MRRSLTYDASSLDASGKRVAIVASRFNEEVVSGLLKGAQTTLKQCGVSPDDMPMYWAPGAFELPIIAQRLAATGNADAVVCLGAVIKGDTAHFEYISAEVASGLARVSLDTGVPCAFGVLTCYTQEQAVARSSDDAHNKGIEAARAALETLLVLDQIADDSASNPILSARM